MNKKQTLKLELQPITLKEAQKFVNEHHRHNVETKLALLLCDLVVEEDK
jgi:hypothetical protein